MESFSESDCADVQMVKSQVTVGNTPYDPQAMILIYLIINSLFKVPHLFRSAQLRNNLKLKKANADSPVTRASRSSDRRFHRYPIQSDGAGNLPRRTVLPNGRFLFYEK